MSIEYGERNDRLNAFTDYARDQSERLVRLSELLSEALPMLDHFDEPGGINPILIKVARQDLVITEPAPMMPVEQPSEIAEKCSNFTANFRMRIGTRESGTLDLHDRPVLEAIPPTADDILALKAVPIVQNYGESKKIEEAATFRAFSALMTHAARPAFIRMLNLWPDFTTDLVTRISDPVEKYRDDHFEAELFVAYQLMSHLVDTSDPNVVRNGEIYDWYLCG